LEGNSLTALVELAGHKPAVDARILHHAVPHLRIDQPKNTFLFKKGVFVLFTAAETLTFYVK